MDARLLTAINDTLTYGGIGAVAAGGAKSAEAGPTVRQSMLDMAATKNASTGTPISSLRGVAAERATKAAVAGGAKSAGGGGIVGGERLLDQKALQVQLAVYGVMTAAVVLQIGIRYAVLVRRDRKTAREAAAEADND